ncbi:FecR domain-containing protein [Aquimarina gracilis]|uniref:FecR domain-containing protein n=1 Tax=Aquimarina gracilis TaxID=874422 RepID=A0ABU5ZXH5_9FLAO|nr:FecR domain-containing protein [Aquimarina gracilis]MEB3346572.1 FecR domain-containing protein [Aquimarina gracilis]
MQEKDLIKYIKGETNPNESKSIIEWIRSDGKHQKRFNVLKAKYIASHLDSLNHIDTDLPYKRFSNKNKKKKIYYYPTAAILILLPLFAWYLFTYSENNTLVDTNNLFHFDTKNIVTKYGDQETIVLPDGSIAVLNSNSRLTYSKKFSDSTRTVTLVGEAFFDIKRDTTKPFIVKTEHLNVRVLGTSFNVKSYPNDENIETTLVTGKVEVLQKSYKSPILLTPSQRAIFDKRKNDIAIDNVDTQKAVAWRQGKLVFDKTPLKQVVLDLKRKYNVEFVIESDSLLNYKYTGEFDNLSLEEVLKLFKLSSSINYKYKNNKIMLNSE